ncbi:MAG: hypothetical protein LBI64_03580 [Coriobacteriales bacterium]|jgi:hypothetical protein|nr:hypothetical protein [Coriobacteriales bacterium]
MPPTGKKARSRAAVGIGLTTLVTIMVVVLLTTFSVLSLVSARSDLNLTNKALQSMQDYYAADTAAEQWVAQLSRALEGASGESLAAALEEGGYIYEFEEGQMGYRVSEIFEIDTNRQLTVELAISDEGQFTILTWQSVPANNGNQG